MTASGNSNQFNHSSFKDDRDVKTGDREEEEEEGREWGALEVPPSQRWDPETKEHLCEGQDEVRSLTLKVRHNRPFGRVADLKLRILIWGFIWAQQLCYQALLPPTVRSHKA